MMMSRDAENAENMAHNFWKKMNVAEGVGP